MDILLINCIVYIATSLFFLLKNKEFNIYTFLWFAYAFTAFMAYYCVKEGYYYNVDTSLGTKLNAIPYIANYIFTFIVLSPFYRYNVANCAFHASPGLSNKYKIDVIKFSMIIFVVYGVLCFTGVLVAASIGYAEIYEASHEAGKDLVALSNPILATIYNWGGIYYEVFRPLVVVLLAEQLIFRQFKGKLLYAGLVVCFLPYIFSAIGHANRGGIFFIFIEMTFLYLFLQKQLPTKVKKRIIVAGCLILTVLLFYSVLISNSRFVEGEGKQEDTFGATSRYFGEPMANLGDMYYGKVKHFGMGETFFPEFSDAPKFNGLGDFFTYWNNKLGVDIDYMGTLFGDCYIQFDLVGAFIFIILLVSIWKKCFFKSNIFMVPLVYYYFRVFAIGGLFGYGFYDARTHLFCGVLILLCYWLKSKEVKRI